MTDLRPYLRAVTGSSKLTVGDRLVLHVLATYANETGRAWPSSATMSDACGMHPVAIRRCLGRLVEAGVIAAETRTGRSTVYRFPLHPSTTCNPSATGDYPQPATERLRTCNPARPKLQPVGYTELRSIKEEERARYPQVDIDRSDPGVWDPFAARQAR